MVISALFNAVFIILSLMTGLICYPLSLLRVDMLVRFIVRQYGRAVIGAFKFIMRVKVTYEGRENVPPLAPVIIAPKHQSYGDSYSLYTQGLNATFVLGRFTADMPIVKTIVKSLGFVTVDETGGARAFRDFKNKIDRLKTSRLVIYPEGAISAVGKTVGYKAGVYYAYKKLGCPVVPVATNMGKAWPFNYFRKHRSNITVRYLPAIPAGLSKKDFMARLEREIEEATRELTGL